MSYMNEHTTSKDRETDCLTTSEVVNNTIGLDGNVRKSGDVEQEHAVGVQVRQVREGHQLLFRLVVLRLVRDRPQVLWCKNNTNDTMT